MQLDCREEGRSPEQLYELVRDDILRFSVGGAFLVFLLHFIGPLIPFYVTLILGSVAGTVRLVQVFFSAPRKWDYWTLFWVLLQAFFVPLGYVIGGAVLGYWLSYRPLASALFGTTAIAILFSTWDELHPIMFYREWLFTAPHLRPETKADRDRIIRGGIPSKGKRFGLMLAVVAPVLILIVVVPAYSPSLAILLVFVFALYLNDFRPWQTWAIAKEVLARYLTYGDELSGAAGSWIPAATVKRRRRAARWTVFLFYLAVSAGLCLYFPSDLVHKNLQTGAPKAGKTTEPSDFWQVIGQTSDSVLKTVFERNTDTHEGRRELFRAMWTTKSVNLRLILLYFVLPFLLAIFLPNFLILGMFRHQLLQCEALREKVASLDRDKRTEWDWYVDRLRASPHVAIDTLGNEVREAEHLFLGLEPTLKFPILIDRKILSEHCYIVGATGSGKTSLGIIPLLIQLLRGGRGGGELEIAGAGIKERVLGWFHRGAVRLRRLTNIKLLEAGETRLFNKYLSFREERFDRVKRQAAIIEEAKAPMVIIDLKGDPALFHTMRVEARKNGQEFLHFTLEQGKSSYLFNPFQSFQSEHRTLIQLCNLFLDALSLNHGDNYGKSYYSRQARRLLFDALSGIGSKDGSKPKNFPDLLQAVELLSNTKLGRERYRDTFELVATIHALTQYKQLITSEKQEIREGQRDVIHMPTVIDKRQVVYFWLPAAVESISVREVGKLALFCLLTAAIDRQREGKKPVQTYLVMDEFHKIAGENLKIVLEQARSFGLSVILANQTMSDLKNRDWDLRPTIRANARLQLFFSTTDPMEVKTLSSLSGEELAEYKSETTGVGMLSWNKMQEMTSVSFREELKPRLTTNDIARVSDHPLELLAYVTRGSGYTQFGGIPIPVRTTWPMSKHRYLKRLHWKWPRNGTVVASQAPTMVDKTSQAEIKKMMIETLQYYWEKSE